MIAGAGGEVATRAEAVLAAVRPAGRIPVPGRARRADLIDAAFLGGTAAHGIELDDGFRQGSVHPGCVVVPAVLALGYERRITGAALIEAVVAGYEAEIAIGRACHPDLRQRGFHPAAAVGVFGSAMAAGKLRRLSAAQLANALGIAASSAAGLFAFVNGGADIKRLHAGHASREGLQAALLAEQGVEGPPGVIEARDGFMQAFAFGRADKPGPRWRAKRAASAATLQVRAPDTRLNRARRRAPSTLPPAVPFGITDCYIKPYPCCRHIQPAVEALIGLLNDEKIATDEVQRIDVATYRIAAEHAETGWDDFASAQLSFAYLMGLALRFRGIKVEHFTEEMRRDPAFAAIRPQAPRDRAAGHRPALSATASGAGDGDDRARQLHPPGRRGARLAHRAARRRRPQGQVPGSGRSGVRPSAGEGADGAACGRSMRSATLRRW